MGMYKLDVSWRKAEPIDVLVNPFTSTLHGFRPTNAPREIEALCGDRPGRRSVRFQLNTLGVIWFADSHVAMHGDESRGRIIPSSVPRGLTWADYLLKASCLIYGGIEFPSWRVEAHCSLLDLASISSPAKILNEFKTWRNATDGVDIELIGLPKPVWIVSAVFNTSEGDTPEGEERVYTAGSQRHTPTRWPLVAPEIIPRSTQHDAALQLAGEQHRRGVRFLVETVKERAARRGLGNG